MELDDEQEIDFCYFLGSSHYGVYSINLQENNIARPPLLEKLVHRRK